MDNIQRIGYEAGFEECEFFSLSGRGFYYTYDCFQNYTNITIDEQFIYGNFPDVFRGGKPGEVYVTSRFPDNIFKISFSSDTGYHFRVVHQRKNYAYFMTDRKAGDFYVISAGITETQNPYGWHSGICIDHYTDYGETLAGRYCHQLTREGVVTAVEETSLSDKVTIYPNPAEGKIQVRGDGLQVTHIEVFDLLGKRVLDQHAAGGMQHEIDMSKLPAGIYLVRIRTEKGCITKKVVKQ